MRIIIILFISLLSLQLTGCTVLQPSNSGGALDENCSVCSKSHAKGQGCGTLGVGCNTKNECCPPEEADCCVLKDICEDVNEPLIETNCVETQLIKTAKSIERSLGVLAAAQQADDPPILSTGPLVTPEGGMGHTMDIDWTGPIGPLVERIARMTNYRVKFLGCEPAIPIVVSITGRRLVIAEVLQNVSFQAVKRASVLVFPSNRVIEVRYNS